MKKCSRCGVAKPLSDFYKNRSSRDGLHSYCKPCFVVVNRRWFRANPEKQRAYTLRKKYGLSVAAYRAIFDLQDGRCAICVRKLKNESDGHVDHDHRIGVVRGILCGSCNRGLGLFQDDEMFLREAAAYLENAAERQGELGAK